MDLYYCLIYFGQIIMPTSLMNIIIILLQKHTLHVGTALKSKNQKIIIINYYQTIN